MGCVVVGLGYSLHDSSVSILQDGALVASVARERLTRFKHDGDRFGTGQSDLSACLRYCLEAANLTLDQVDLFVENDFSNRSFDELRAEVARFDVPYPAERTIMIGHHLAHAYGAYYWSGFDDAVILVVDGSGNSAPAILGYEGEDTEYLRRSPMTSKLPPHAGETVSLYIGRGDKISVLRKDFTTSSLGECYARATHFVFGTTVDAGKLMGLAPYGRPGRFPDPLLSSTNGEITYPYKSTFASMMAPRPARRWPEEILSWSEELRWHADLAWQVQTDLERVLLDVATTAQQKTGIKRLCIAGGVGLNSVANKIILDEAGFDEVFIMPAAGDDGISIGCSFYGAHRLGHARTKGQRHAYLGRTYPARDIEAAVSSDLRLATEQLDEWTLIDRTAKTIAEGKLVGWFQGGSEVGPRALGHRSILADPRNPEMKLILNSRVKYRESFRPFAPVVPLEDAHKFFDLSSKSPYMLLIAGVNESARSVVPAITHVDGTARVQTVTSADNDLFYRLVKAFGTITGVPVLLNTSMNINGEPMVETPAEAVDCLLGTGLDAMAIGNWWVEKKVLDDETLRACAPVANPRMIVRQQYRFDGDRWKVFAVNAKPRENDAHSFELSESIAELLLQVNGRRSVAELASAMACHANPDDADAFTLKAVRELLAVGVLRLPVAGLALAGS